MSDLDKILEFMNPGVLNSTSLERFGLKKDQYNHRTLAQVRAAIGEVYSKALESGGENKEYNAVCLAVTQDKIADVPGISVVPGKVEKGSGYLLRVVARIPELHSAIPKPLLKGVDKLSCSNAKNAAILLHPIFYGIIVEGEFPKPGNKIKVKFPNPNDRSYGHFIKVLDPTSEVTTPDDQGAADIAIEGAETTVGESE